MMKKDKNLNTKRSSLAKKNIQKFMRNRMAVIGGTVMLLIIFACVFAPLLTSWDPTFCDPSQRELPCSAEHLLGTDRVGRDIFARILYGGRTSIMIGVGCALGAGLLGTILGCIAGFFGGKVDAVLVFIQELFATFPQLLLILLFSAYVGGSIANIFIIFIATSWTGTMRVVRSNIMALKQEPFAESCRANGISNRSIMFHHLLPNTLGSVIVSMTLTVSGFILTEASLCYLGVGIPSEIPTWGNIINAAKRMDIILNMPTLWLAPGLAIGLFSLSVNFFGDGLRDVFDPTAQ